jgi:hypothetical protein
LCKIGEEVRVNEVESRGKSNNASISKDSKVGNDVVFGGFIFYTYGKNLYPNATIISMESMLSHGSVYTIEMFVKANG